MSDPADGVRAWLFEAETAALEPPALLDGLVARLVAAGIALHRVSVWIPTKHPELWGNQLAWDGAAGARVVRRSHAVSSSVDYVGTPAEALHQSGSSTLRCRLDREPERRKFAMLAAMADAGATDYFMASLEPGEQGASWVSFASAAPGGFAEEELALLTGLTPLLALHVRLAAATFATRSLLEVYLGANASRRVLSGEFHRGTGSAPSASRCTSAGSCTATSVVEPASTSP